MFSSLEALDAEDNLHATPVARPGAFQPKAKPRARKGGAGPARTPASAPASKTKSLPPSATNAADQNDQRETKQNDVAKLQEDAETAVDRNIESQSVGITPEVLNKVGIETGSTHNSVLVDDSLIISADLTAEPEGVVNTDFDAAKCQAILDLHEPLALAEAPENSANAIIEMQESVPFSSQVLSDQDAIGCLSTVSQGNMVESLTRVSDTPSAFDELLASHAFVPSAVLETSGASRKKKRPRKDRQDNLLAVVDQGGLVVAKDAPVDDRGTTSNCEAKPSKKKKGNGDDAYEQQERVSVEATSIPKKKTKRAKVSSLAASVPVVDAAVADETTQEEATKTAVEPAKKKRKGCKQVQEGRDDGKDCANTIREASSKKNKKIGVAGSVFASASESAAEVAIEVNRVKESAQEAVQTAETKQERVGGQQELGEAHTSLGASKRKRRKPARFLDGADDEANVTIASIKGASELAKESRRQESRADQQQDFAGNDLLSELFPSLPKKISKLKESKLASFNATANATPSQPSLEAATGPGKPVTPTAEENQKKKFKKFVPRRRRVERRAMNPANPDLDPKKMTMKDIIRLAEAKERMLKKDNAKKAKNGNQVTANEPEREPESRESTCMAPQVQIVDGQIVINEQSLVINAHPKDDIRSYKRVEETHAKLNYHSYMKRTRTQTWRPEETELFYQALREFGTNFAMMQHLFPGRTRKQVLLKYKKEERCSPLRITEAMRVKPCDTFYFSEVMSSLNLLPSEIPNDLESGQASVLEELSSSEKEIDNNAGSSEGGESRLAEGAGCALKLDEPSVHSMNQETYDKSDSSPCNIEALNSGQPNGNQELTTEEAAKLHEMDKPFESSRKAPSPPPRKKKSLFSYQTSTTKS